MKTVMYSRVSSAQQNHDSQETQVQGYAKRADWKIDEIYRDTISGKKSDREGLNRLLEDCRKGEIERILCYRMDRLGRNTLHFLGLLQQLKTLKIPIYFTSEGITTEDASPIAEMLMTIGAAFGQMETAYRAERQSAGIAAKKARGEHMGRPGYPIETQNKIVELSLTGLSQRQIAKEVSVSQFYVSKILNKK